MDYLIDAYIGERIRMRRHILGMSQTDLGQKIGVTFQQIQKYEKGNNKIVASKLYDLAKIMDVSIGYFFDNFKSTENNKDYLNDNQAEFQYNDKHHSSTREAITLVKLFNNIPSQTTKKRLLLLLKSLSSDAE